MESAGRAATLGDINRLEASIAALTNTVHLIARQVLDHTKGLRELKETTATKADLRDVNAKLDYLMGKSKDNDNSYVMLGQMYGELKVRVTVLESKIQ